MSRFCAVTLLLLAPLALGCECEEEVRSFATHRDKLLLADEPSGAQGVIDLRETLTGRERPVIVVGRIGGGKPVFSEDHASFVIVDPVATGEHHHADGCDENCPFCSKGSDPTAVAYVQCVDGAGQTLPLAADRLLGVEEGQTIVIQGRARIDDTDNLIVVAEGIYVRS